MIAAVEWSLIFEVVWVSLVAGIGVTILFSLVVFGSSRATEARREGNGSPAAFALLAVVTMLAFLGAVAFGIAVILSK